MIDLLVLLTAHFVGDFIAQSDRMATLKSKDWWALLTHVWIYTVVVVLVATALALYRSGDARGLLLFLPATFALHFVQDAVTSRITSKLWFVAGARAIVGQLPDSDEPTIRAEVVYTGTRHWFFVMIGCDQLLHAYALAWAWTLVR